MILYGIIFFTIHTIRSTSSVGIKIEGLIDLGPKWNYEYKVSNIDPVELSSKASRNLSLITNVRKDNENNSNVKAIKKEQVNNKSTDKTKYDFHKKLKQADSKQKLVNNDIETSNNYLNNILMHSETTDSDFHNIFTDTTHFKNTRNSGRGGSTQIYSENDEENFKKPSKKENKQKHELSTNPDKQKANVKDKRKVKDDEKVHNFNEHISKQSLKVFEIWKKNTDSLKTKTKIDMLQNNFIDKFSRFMKQNENYVLRTKLAQQKVVVNLMDTASKMMQRCIYYLAQDETVRRNVNIQSLQKELNRQTEIENIHACKVLGACRTSDAYTEFIINILTTVLQASNDKVLQASNAITEAIKSNDFSDVLDTKAEDYINKSMFSIELLNSASTRAMLLIFRNVLLNRNKPIFIMNDIDKNVAQRTEALHNLMDLLNKHMNTNENKREWREIEKEVMEWKSDQRKDILSTVERIFKQLKRQVEKLSQEVKDKISEYIKVLHKKLKP